MWSGEARARYGVLPVVLAWGFAAAAAPQPPVRVATTPPIVPAIEPRAGGSAAAAPHVPFSPLAPLVPFGPWHRPAPDKRPGSGPLRPAAPPVAPGQGPSGNLPPREAPGKHEPAPVRVPVTPPVATAVHRVYLPTSVVLRALDSGEAAFRACWVRAHRQNATPSTGKIQIHIEVDTDGKVTLAHSDTDAAELDRCVCNVAAHLPFSARGQPASAELSLLFPVTP